MGCKPARRSGSCCWICCQRLQGRGQGGGAWCSVCSSVLAATYSPWEGLHIDRRLCRLLPGPREAARSPPRRHEAPAGRGCHASGSHCSDSSSGSSSSEGWRVHSCARRCRRSWPPSLPVVRPAMLPQFLLKLTEFARRLKHLGAHVIATTSTEQKAALAKANGAEHVVIYSKDTLPEVVRQVKALTPDGEGVHAVFDGVGVDTWESDFEVVRRKATLVTFGNASGPVPPFAPLKLAAKNLKGIFHDYLPGLQAFSPVPFRSLPASAQQLRRHKRRWANPPRSPQVASC